VYEIEFLISYSRGRLDKRAEIGGGLVGKDSLKVCCQSTFLLCKYQTRNRLVIRENVLREIFFRRLYGEVVLMQSEVSGLST